jgi:hypothetical protein
MLHVDLMRQEFVEMVLAGQWLVLLYSMVRDLPNLHLLPTGAVPQRDRRLRPIVDYSYSGINKATISHAPDSIQFGNAFYRFLHRLQLADTCNGPIFLSKTHISDAFMRVWIALSIIPSLGALLPTHMGEEPLVAFPLILPMGWMDSPNYLCALSETAADLANSHFSAGHLTTARHPLANLANTKRPAEPSPPLPAVAMSLPPPNTRSHGPLQKPLKYVDVYMDDFLHATQLPPAEQARAQDTLFECIDQVLRPLAPTNNPHRKDQENSFRLAH